LKNRKAILKDLMKITMMIRLISFLCLFMVSDAFVPHKSYGSGKAATAKLRMSSSSSIVIISPPGGVGEVAAVKAACLGFSARWFVVSDTPGSSVTLTPQALEQIADASGSLELAGASVEDLKAGGDALSAVSKWCGTANGIICSYDGCNYDEELKAALRLAAKEASMGVTGPQVAVLAAEEDLDDGGDDNDGGVADLVGSLFRNAPKIPPTMIQSLANSVCVIRHGQLFGTPESSPNFSPLVGGPRREPVITEELTMRNVRIDPFVVSGNVMASSSLKSCRHAVGEAAALLATGTIPAPTQPVSISSQTGSEEWSVDQWQEEFARVKELITSGKASTLFSQDMIVDDSERLADWLATKWAPAVMRTYDIAAIRIGARPVSASRTADSIVEIVWQELVDFKSIMVGKMILEVSKDGITATRGAGDASKGFGSVSKKPLPGEDVLVRRLSEAASQAVEKGLAKKVWIHEADACFKFHIRLV
jgi:hypothetical protein